MTIAARRAAGDTGSGASRAQGLAQGYVSSTVLFRHVRERTRLSICFGAS